MEDRFAALHALAQGCRIGQVADHQIGAQSVEVFPPAAGPHQQAQVGSLRGQQTGHVTAHESRCSGYKRLHNALSPKA